MCNVPEGLDSEFTKCCFHSHLIGQSRSHAKPLTAECEKALSSYQEGCMHVGKHIFTEH